MRINIQSHSTVPIYEQIVEGLKESIIKGELKAGESLPSIRQLAADLSVSVITTKRAYEELEKQGFIITLSSKGSYVGDLSESFHKERILVEIEAKLQEVQKLAFLASLSTEDVIAMYHTMEQQL